MVTDGQRQMQPVISDAYDSDRAKLELWERMAKAVIRAYSKLPMAQHNVSLNDELSDLAVAVRELEPSLKSYYPLD
jgi:hypothetical protein